MKSLFLRFGRWLMFLWVRVEVFPDNDPTSILKPERPILYILADRGLSDSLVLTEVCGRLNLPDPRKFIAIDSVSDFHSVYRLASTSPFTDWVRRRDNQPSHLKLLVDLLETEEEFGLQIVPVSVFWGRPLARQKHWLQVLFADTWALAGRSRKLLTILIHGRQTRLIFSPALEFRELAEQVEFDPNKLHELLIQSLGQQREATFGPEVTSRNRLISAVVEDEKIQRFFSENKNDGKNYPAKARNYCREIFANNTLLTIEVMRRILRFFWNRYYSGIEVHNITRVQEIALSHQLIYVPCHRSHVDYLLLSYVIFNENLAIPYIAAGSNLNVPVIGRILRGGGAFFIRRSFKDNPLYGEVMRAYLKQLVALGAPLEYFIEGGRSRSGRLLKPKFGMLTMTVDAYLHNPTKPLAFVPVYIGYEKLMEGKSYLGELYGAKKERETTMATLKAIFRVKGEYGKVSASFGEPIELNPLLEQHNPDWRAQIDNAGDKPDWYQSSLTQLARQIMHGINRAVVVNPVNAIATVLLATSRQSIEIEELIDQVALHNRIIGSATATSQTIILATVDRKEIERIAELKMITIKSHPLGDIVHLGPDDAIQMSYYRNNSLHTLIIPALIAACFANNLKLSRAKLIRKIMILFPFLKSEMQLEWETDELAGIIDDYIACMIEVSLLKNSEGKLARPRRSDRQFVRLFRLAQIAQPILERYYMTFVVLWQSSKLPQLEDEIEHRCHLLAQKISMIYGINSPDFFDRVLFREFISTMLDAGYLLKNTEQQLIFSKEFRFISVDLRGLLSHEIRSSILALINQ